MADDWSIFKELDQDESYRQRVLRPYDEASVQKDGENVTAIRRRLDDALDRLTLFEVERQLDLPHTVELPPDLGPLHSLFRSDAFLHYVNTYLYFAIRFLPETLGLGEDPRTTRVNDGTLPDCDDLNTKRFPLRLPPLREKAKPKRTYAKLRPVWDYEDQKVVAYALYFLDMDHGSECPEDPYDWGEGKAFELWLRGLYPEADKETIKRFETIRTGLKLWGLERSRFYRDNFSGARSTQPCQNKDLQVSDPIAARVALLDLYWIARFLRAEVSSTGWVRYQRSNWLHLLQFNTLLAGAKQQDSQEDPKAWPDPKEYWQKPLEERQEHEAYEAKQEADRQEEFKALRDAETTLRSVFDLVLYMVQNSIEVTDAPSEVNRPSTTTSWRQAFDEELDEILQQRSIRDFQGLLPRPAKEKTGWSKRVLGDEYPEDRIGLALSGGGIRSATLNLGVLEGLMELDFLRHFDYLSTVSGGGFIGSWLVGNVRRSKNWLGRNTDWSESIQHLRNYSNYLSPRSGILSADTWNLGNSWLRNTLLIQLTGIAWLFVLLLSAVVSMRLFLYAGEPHWRSLIPAKLVAILGSLIFAASVSFYLYGNTAETNELPPSGATSSWVERIWRRFNEGEYVVRISAVAAWVAACAIASFFWSHAPMYTAEWPSLVNVRHYSEILEYAWLNWELLLVASFAGIAILSYFTLQGSTLWLKKILGSAVVGLVCTLVLYLELSGIFYYFRALSAQSDVANSIVFITGPAMVLLAFTVCILLLIGFTGRNSLETQREWWTRFGTWLGILGGVIAFVSSVALLGPWLILKLFDPRGHNPLVKGIQWTSILGWLGTVISGTLAGKSSKTSGASGEAGSSKLQLLATVGGFLFIVGSFLLGSTLLYILLFEMFGPDYTVAGSNALHIFCELSGLNLSLALVAVAVIGIAFSWFFEVNIFGFSQFYRNRVVRCYLGATRWAGQRNPNAFTKLDPEDDLGLWRFRTDSPGAQLPRTVASPLGTPETERSGCQETSHYRGPLPILGCTLNLGGSSDLSVNTRHGDSFTLTPLRCGSDRPNVGYAPTVHQEGDVIQEGYAAGIQLGQSVAVSGAAVSPNMGYNTSPLVAFLLTMFNVRLGWWFPNPGRSAWKRSGLSFSLYYLAAELLGLADDTRSYVNVCDGGNFENLAIYELVRRRCRLIIACDAECDEQMQFGSLGKMIRLCETDFGAIIDLDVNLIRPLPGGNSRTHAAVGLIKYCTGEVGYLIYLKASITGDESVSIAQYRSTHPSFPHESTADQFYSEDQFESYRALGLHMVRKSFQGVAPGADPLSAAERLYDILAPAGPPTDKFLQHAQSVIDLWEKFRNSRVLLNFMHELVTVADHPQPAIILNDELCIGLEVIQIMEDVFLDLRLDDFWEHPDNRGWAILFMRWARSPRLRKIWNSTHRTFGIRFEYFCNARLGLKRDVPVVRV